MISTQHGMKSLEPDLKARRLRNKTDRFPVEVERSRVVGEVVFLVLAQ